MKKFINITSYPIFLKIIFLPYHTSNASKFIAIKKFEKLII